MSGSLPGPGGAATGSTGGLATGGRDDVTAVVLAAGQSRRMGGGLNKVFYWVAGRPLLVWSLGALAAAGIRRFVVVLRGDDVPLWERWVQPRLPWTMETAVVVGGEEREDSVFAALTHLAPLPPPWVLIHDGARPLVTPHLVRRVLEAARRYGAAVPALPVRDTIKRVAPLGFPGPRPKEASARGSTPPGGPGASHKTCGAGDRPAPSAAAAPEGVTLPEPAVDWVEETLPRHVLRAVQTPQGFAFPLLWRAHQAARSSGQRGFTDDAAMVERLGVPVAVVPGDPQNLKLTYPDDLPAIEMGLAGRPGRPKEGPEGAESLAPARTGGPVPGEGEGGALPLRFGIGYDVHPVAAGRRLVLGGVDIPASFGLAGHSDADVVLHAVMDALLGAAGLPDIGQLFPSSEPRWAGVDSRLLAQLVVQRLQEAGWAPVQVDVTVVAEQPRLAPYVQAMRREMASVLGVPPARVGLKATTHEGLGAIGRGEGIAALAVAVIAPRRAPRV